MVILNKDNLIKTLLFLLCVFCIGMDSYGETAEELLKKTCGIKIDEGNDKPVVELLPKFQVAYDECNDVRLASKLKYQIGVINFKAGKYHEAYRIFSEIVNNSSGNELLAPALNMMAHSARFCGNNEVAEDTFLRLVDILKKDDDCTTYNSNLLLNSWFSLGELYSNTKPDKAIGVYSDIINNTLHLQLSDNDKVTLKAAKLKSQLMFKGGDYEGYIKTINNMIPECPVEEACVLELQNECLKILINDGKLIEGLYPEKLPIYTMSLVKDGGNSEGLLKCFEALISKYNTPECLVYLNYHYAWLLDSLGDKKTALTAFSNVVNKAELLKEKSKYLIFGEYAKVQSAIILGEMGEYSLAQKKLEEVSESDAVHLQQVADSVKKSLEVLKREVSNDKK